MEFSVTIIIKTYTSRDVCLVFYSFEDDCGVLHQHQSAVLSFVQAASKTKKNKPNGIEGKQVYFTLQKDAWRAKTKT